MKLLILVMITTWSFGGGYQNTPSYQIVYSAEEAAIIVYNNEKIPKFSVESDRQEYRLYSVDLLTKEITPLPIPKVEFKL